MPNWEMLEHNETTRLAIGLAHAVPGAELTVRRADGARLVAANRPGTDVDLCTLRRTIIAGFCPGRPDASRWIGVDEIAGSLRKTEATLKPDACLGVTAIGLAGVGQTGELSAAETTRRLHEVCLVDELIARSRRPERPSVSRRKEQPND